MSDHEHGEASYRRQVRAGLRPCPGCLTECARVKAERRNAQQCQAMMRFGDRCRRTTTTSFCGVHHGQG